LDHAPTSSRSVFISCAIPDLWLATGIEEEVKSYGAAAMIDERLSLAGADPESRVRAALQSADEVLFVLSSRTAPLPEHRFLKMAADVVTERKIPAAVLLCGVTRRELARDRKIPPLLKRLDRYDYKDRVSYFRDLTQRANTIPPPHTSKTADASLSNLSRGSEAFDIVLCADDLDGPEVRRIAEWLDRQGLHPWPDATADFRSVWRADQGERLMTAKAAIAIVGRSGKGPWAAPGQDALLEHYNLSGRIIIPLKLPTCPGTPELPPYLLYRRWVDFRGPRSDPADSVAWEVGFRQLERAIIGFTQPETAPSIFFSYSQKDEKWLEKLKSMLFPLMKPKTISIWWDGEINPGQTWRKEIDKAMANAKVGVLLVSMDYLASKFISDCELDYLLDAAEQGQIKLLWVYVGFCFYDKTGIGRYQAAHRRLKPLNSYRRRADWEKVLKEICRNIAAACGYQV